MTTIELALLAMNSAFEDDPKAVNELCGIRVECNEKLADHPTVQVMESDGKFKVGVIGMINGIIEPITGKRIAMIIDSGSLTGFCEYKEPQC